VLIEKLRSGLSWVPDSFGHRCRETWCCLIGDPLPPRESYGIANSRAERPQDRKNGEQSLTASTGHAFRKNAAGAFGPDLARKLSQLVKMEKNVMRSMELVARERMDVAVC
jgi:hypothetical protein